MTARQEQAHDIDTSAAKLPSSFRDPCGFIFEKQGVLYRQVSRVYQQNYDLLMKSGLYERLVKDGKMVPHQEVEGVAYDPDTAYKILAPEHLDFISYPYEWCFSQLKNAAVLTLDIQLMALKHNMSLKDASAYNIQFKDGGPVFIDTLSFEQYQEGRPWVAYRQFCQHFLAPLALMAKKDIRFGRMLALYLDGIPLDLASAMLPGSTWFRPGLALHLHVHAKTQKAYGQSSREEHKDRAKHRPVSRAGLEGILNSLARTVEKLHWEAGGTEWGDYYADTNYTESAFGEKTRLIAGYLDVVKPEKVWDMGANTGVFSRIASSRGILTFSFDMDPAAVEINYRQACDKKEKRLLPLLMDLTNPSASLGWDCQERSSIYQRGPADCVMALALMHHLAVSNNVPFDRMAEMFWRLGKYLIIEFIPKSDSQVRRLLRSREDIFDQYNQSHFEAAFSSYFSIEKTEAIKGSERILYLMKNKEA